MRILISACLLGTSCRYDGGNNERPWIKNLMKNHTLIPVCPEQLGGLSTPRPPVEWVDGKAMNNEGRDCTEEFMRGAQEALRLTKLYDCRLAILKAKSPSCGSQHIYDGTFSGTVIEGKGATARLLEENRIAVLNEYDAERFFIRTGL